MATKKEMITQEVARTVGAGKPVVLETVDFSDPNRPKTCLEVDFPILPVNEIAKVESSSGAGRKPVYTMSKWWARRPSSVFRSILLSAATKAPESEFEAASLVFKNIYKSHKANSAMQSISVLDPFMGGGTTIVEGLRLGLRMVGNELNPLAWFIVKNELSIIDASEIEALLDDIEKDVRPEIAPFIACDGPNGEKGVWTHKPTNRVMGEDFDPLSLRPEERKDYSYEGPEIIYTFWAKHGPCQVTAAATVRRS